jgi:hypothetical protein
MMSKKKSLLSRKKGSTDSASAVQALLTQVASMVEILHVRLIGGTLNVAPSDENQRPDPIQYSTSFHLNVDTRALDCRVQFEFLGRVPAVAPPHRVVRVTATYLVTYLVRAGKEPSVEALTAFSQINTTYNAWPYWREFLQSALQRMDLPPFVAPLLRAGQIAHSAERDSDKREAQATKE